MRLFRWGLKKAGAPKPTEPSPQPPPPAMEPDPAAGPPRVATCVVCGAPVQEVRCNVRCPNCGYTEDCTDLFFE